MAPGVALTVGNVALLNDQRFRFAGVDTLRVASIGSTV